MNGFDRNMLTTPWKKVLLDLWEHRMRTLIVALAIAVGVYAVGVVLNTREILVREYHDDQAGALVPSAILHTQPFDDDLAANLAKLPQIAAAEGRSLIRTRVYPDAQTPQDLVLVAVPEFSDM
jgi:putative ABC transport system permease protein